MSLIPANTGVYRDMTQIRFQHPQWIPGNCTACGDCFTVCPDSAIPGLACTLSDAFNTTIKRVERRGHEIKHLRRAVRTVEKKLRKATEGLEGNAIDVGPLLAQTITETVSEVDDADRRAVEEEFAWFQQEMGGFKWSFTKPYFRQKEKRQKGSGGLFAITVNPYSCKGCMLCVEVCNDNALQIVDQTPETIETLHKDWDFWLDLPTTSPDFIPNR